MENQSTAETIPLVQEVPTIEKRAVESGRVRVRTFVEDVNAEVVARLSRDEIKVERRPVEQEVEQAPAPRHDGDTLILSLVEERPVVVKRLFVVEELHIRRTERVEDVSIPTTTRAMRAVVEREDAPGTPSHARGVELDDRSTTGGH